MFHCISDDKRCPVYRGVLISDALIRGVFPAIASSMYDHVRVCPAYMCICIIKKDGWCLRTTEFSCLNHSVLSATHNYAPPTGHTHFTLRQQLQASLQLRNDMLQKGGCGLDIIQRFNLP